VATDNFDFEELLYEAVARESENLDGDDTEGYPFEPVTTEFSSPVPVSSVPEVHLDGSTPGPSMPDNTLPLSPPLLLLGPTQSRPSSPFPASSSVTKASNPQPGKKRKHAKGSKEDIRRKEHANAKRAVARLTTKRAAPYGDYMVKPRVINKYVRPATAVDVKFDAMKLRHTKTGYTGGHLKSGRRIYRLDELVGDGSIFKFRLETWDGKLVHPQVL
jgi:hypothetical protein